MAELPRHPDDDRHAGIDYHREAAKATWRTYAIVAVVVVVVLAMVVLHLAGVVGPGSN
jgi:t-SNARE complex subunit (syntaxin)